MLILARVVADRGVARFMKWGGQSMKSSGRTGIRRGLPYTHYTGCGKKVSPKDFGQYSPTTDNISSETNEFK